MCPRGATRADRRKDASVDEDIRIIAQYPAASQEADACIRTNIPSLTISQSKTNDIIEILTQALIIEVSSQNSQTAPECSKTNLIV
jgi:hypothetical protein